MNFEFSKFGKKLPDYSQVSEWINDIFKKKKLAQHVYQMSARFAIKKFLIRSIENFMNFEIRKKFTGPLPSVGMNHKFFSTYN